VATAKAQAKQQLDEATARATAIHDGAERRLNLLMSRHTEAIRRLTEIRDVVTTLVAGEAARGSLEEEVARAVAAAQAEANGGQAPVANGARQAQPAEGRRGAATAGHAQATPPAARSAQGAQVPPVQRPAPGQASLDQAAGAGAPSAPVQQPAAKPAAPAASPRTSSASPAGARPAGQHEGARHAASGPSADGDDRAESLRAARD
jgi:hypothetical protein